jgi:hypothetical protein
MAERRFPPPWSGKFTDDGRARYSMTDFLISTEPTPSGILSHAGLRRMRQCINQTGFLAPLLLRSVLRSHLLCRYSRPSHLVACPKRNRQPPTSNVTRNGAIPPLRKPRRPPACDRFRGRLRTLKIVGLRKWHALTYINGASAPVSFGSRP